MLSVDFKDKVMKHEGAVFISEDNQTLLGFLCSPEKSKIPYLHSSDLNLKVKLEAPWDHVIKEMATGVRGLQEIEVNHSICTWKNYRFL